jgi:hypothetical protein
MVISFGAFLGVDFGLPDPLGDFQVTLQTDRNHDQPIKSIESFHR